MTLGEEDNQKDIKWLEEPVFEYVSNNEGCDSVDVVLYFKLRSDIVTRALYHLVKDGKLEHRCIFANFYGYYVTRRIEE